ncbi:hypothetical protein ACFQH2_06185 [Natronoarchaeum sp. GCM10025703]|uniref:hypothetical protein n=1 Tax=unclassified Natronoarchaeum TaxID=2620183 RepID=UPI00362125DA
MSATGKLPYIPEYGTNVFSKDWDVLLILDACRWDMYDEFVGRGEPLWSVGSASGEWMTNTFAEQYKHEMAETAYVTGNPFSENLAHEDEFACLDELWKTHWDSERGTIPPRPITDYAIKRHREGHDRTIAHYMQPHYPFIASEETGGEMTWEIIDDEAFSEDSLALWDQFLYGVRDDIETVREAYEANLRHVWNDVEIVLDNVDGTVAITADHGNALGEYGFWGHKPGIVHPKMRRVPWDIQQATDTGSHQPEIETRTISQDREDQLKELGYM